MHDYLDRAMIGRERMALSVGRRVAAASLTLVVCEVAFQSSTAQAHDIEQLTPEMIQALGGNAEMVAVFDAAGNARLLTRHPDYIESLNKPEIPEIAVPGEPTISGTSSDYILLFKSGDGKAVALKRCPDGTVWRGLVDAPAQ